MKRRARSPAPARRTGPIKRSGPTRRARSDYDFDYAGTTGELDQNEYAGDLYGGGRYGRGPFEQTQRYGERGFESGTGAYGSLQKQFENRSTSGGYAGLKTSGRALGGPPAARSAASKRNRLPRTASAPSSGREAAGAAGGRSAPKPKRAAAGAGARRRGSASPAGGSTAALRQTDARIRQAICERLSRPVEDLDMSDFASEHLDVSDVKVSVAGGRVTLQGTVPERRMKPYIEALVDACPGVEDIDNRLRVRR